MNTDPKNINPDRAPSHPEQLNTDSNTIRGNVYEQVTARIIAMLENGIVPWRSPWKTQKGFPRNLVSGKPYRGVNVFLLLAANYESPFWLTFRQARELGGTVRAGEKATPVVFWKQTTVEDEETGVMREIPFLRYYYVFNIAQCEGGRISQLSEIFSNNTASMPLQIFEGMPQRPPVKYGMNRPFYSPQSDYVGMPDLHSFDRENEFYSTLFHELIHSTGHPSRLNRPSLTAKADFASGPYCKEELVAEMGAAFLCAHARISAQTIENSAAYVQGWLALLYNDKKLLIQAAAQAQKAADFILGVTSPKSREEAEY